MSPPPNQVRLGQLSSRVAATNPSPRRPPAGVRSLLPAGLARENQSRIQDIDNRLNFLESVPTLPATLTASLSSISGTVASVRQKAEINGGLIDALGIDVGVFQRNLNAVGLNLDTRIDGRILPKTNALGTRIDDLTGPNGAVTTAIRNQITEFAKPNGSLDAQIDGKITGFKSSPQFGTEVRSSIATELSSISATNVSVATLSGKVKDRDRPTFKAASDRVNGRFTSGATDIGTETAAIPSFIQDINAKRSSIGDRRARLLKAINGDFGATSAFGLPDAKEAISVLRAALQDISNAIDSLKNVGNRLNNSVGTIKGTFSKVGPDFGTMGSKV